MRRRQLMLLLGGAAITSPLSARAQQKAMPVVGFFSTGAADLPAAYLAAFRQGLGETGYVEGQNVAIEYRWAEDHYDRLPALVADLVSRNVDLILSWGGLVGALAAKRATTTIPIVFTNVGDPIGGGLVASLARPGGNITGFSILTSELTAKRLELLSELVPQARVIALLVNPSNPLTERVVEDAQRAARARGVARCPAGQHRQRDRCRLCRARPTTSRRARRRRRLAPLQPARQTRGAGIAPCGSNDLYIA